MACCTTLYQHPPLGLVVGRMPAVSDVAACRICCMQIYLNNATIEYSNPSEVGTCEQTTTKMILGLQQTLGATNVTFTNNARAPRIVGPVKFTVTVQDAQTSRTGKVLVQQCRTRACCS